jgi:hypothetical protein
MAVDVPTLVQSIITAAQATATQKQAAADSYAATAIQAASGVGLSNPPVLGFTSSIVEPSVYIPQNAVGVDTGLYNTTYNQIYTLLTGEFNSFFGKYFPLTDNSDLTAAEAWMTKALTVGGTGLPAYVEAQIYDRERTTLVREGNRRADEALTMWAGRRYPVPPGALTYQINQINRETNERLAEQSRGIAIKQAELEIENIRFAIEHVLQFRVNAMAAAGEYLKTISVIPQISSQLAIAAIDAQAKMISAASQYYNARIAVDTLKFQIAKTSTDYKMAGQQLDVPSYTTRAGHMATAASSAAQAAGYMASAALNALHSQANLSSITNQ